MSGLMVEGGKRVERNLVVGLPPRSSMKMKNGREENALIDLFEQEPMEALEFIESHQRWMRNPLNWSWYWFNYYRYMVLQWAGWK
jgi:hypothetical protein